MITVQLIFHTSHGLTIVIDWLKVSLIHHPQEKHILKNIFERILTFY